MYFWNTGSSFLKQTIKITVCTVCTGAFTNYYTYYFFVNFCLLDTQWQHNSHKVLLISILQKKLW